MGKIVSEKERKLQRKLIPLNIFVCIIALVAAFSLMFAPIFKIDVGKIMQSEAVLELAEQTITETMGGNVPDGGSEDGEGGTKGSDATVAYGPVIAAVVKNVLSGAEGSVEFSALNAAKVAFASGDAKSDKVMDELFFGENALVTKLIDSIADGIINMFDNPESKEIIEDAFVTSISTALISNLPAEAAEKFTDANVDKLTESIKKFNDVQDRAGAESTVDDFVDKLDEILGDDFNREKDGESVRNYILDLYDSTSAETGEPNVSVEQMVAVAVSKNVPVDQLNLNNILNGLNNKNEDEPAPDATSVIKRVVDEEVGETPETPEPSGDEGGETPDVPETPDTPDTPGNEGGDTPDTPETPDTPDTPADGGDDRVIVTSYSDLLKQMGLDDENKDELKANLKSTLQNLVNDFTESYTEYLGYYGYLFYGMLAFAAPWLILFLFSLFHIFAKNKRFTMWYVKLFGWITGLIGFAVVILKFVLKSKPDILESLIGASEGADIGPLSSMAGDMISAVSTFLWISGVCYLLLWLVSIFWAFPIKRKIRKERKFVKANGYSESDYGGDLGDGGKKNKKNKKEKKNKKNKETDDYGQSYDSEPYGSSAYDGDQYGGSSYDYDSDGFDSPYTGGYYGSYYDDDDIL